MVSTSYSIDSIQLNHLLNYLLNGLLNVLLNHLLSCSAIISATKNTTNDETQAAPIRRRSSAFQMELLEHVEDPHPVHFEPISTEILMQSNRKNSLKNYNQHNVEAEMRRDPSLGQQPYFDPFQTVVQDEEQSMTPPMRDEEEAVEQVDQEEEVEEVVPKYEEQQQQVSVKVEPRRQSTKESVEYVGEPNKEATGIVNDAFNEELKMEEEVEVDIEVDQMTGTETEETNAMQEELGK